MALTREKKEQVLGELKDGLKSSGIVILGNFHGLNTVLAHQLRVLLRELGARYLVAKKTLIKKALDELGISGEMPQLEGEAALVFGGVEVTAPAKSVSKFIKEHPEISFLGGVLEGAYITKAAVSGLAAIPSRDELIAQFIYVINAPRQKMVGVLQAPIRDFISVLGQIKR